MMHIRVRSVVAVLLTTGCLGTMAVACSNSSSEGRSACEADVGVGQCSERSGRWVPKGSKPIAVLGENNHVVTMQDLNAAKPESATDKQIVEAYREALRVLGVDRYALDSPIERVIKEKDCGAMLSLSEVRERVGASVHSFASTDEVDAVQPDIQGPVLVCYADDGPKDDEADEMSFDVVLQRYGRMDPSAQSTIHLRITNGYELWVRSVNVPQDKVVELGTSIALRLADLDG